MPAAAQSLDFIEELVFRCWARRNYLPLELREPDWHPIVLEEMALRDRELEEEQEQRADDLQTQAVSWDFVPLAPTVMHYVHPGHGEIREPHYLSAGNAADSFTESIYAGGIYEFPF